MKHLISINYDCRWCPIITINNMYEIDTQDGAIYFASDYIGNRNRDFPQYIFELRDKFHKIGLVKHAD